MEEPTPVRGVPGLDRIREGRNEEAARVRASERLLAAEAPTPKGVRDERMSALVARLDAAFAELAAVRGELLALGGRVGLVEPRVAALEVAVRKIGASLTALDEHVVGIAAQVGRINVALLKLGALTIVGGAIANALMHAIGLQ